MKRITIKDVAKASGVSIATVSYAINGSVDLPAETRKRVWDAANELGYSPNRSARTLRSGNPAKRIRTRLLMRIVNQGMPDIAGDPVDAEIAQNFDLLANKRGFFTTTYRYYQTVGFRCPLILDGLIDGAILNTPHPEVARTIRSKVPAVLVDAGFKSEYENIPVVNVDIQTAAAEMLAGAGAIHKKAVLLTPPFQILTNHHEKILADQALLEGISLETVFYNGDTPSHLTEMRRLAGIIAEKIRKEGVTLILSRDMVYADPLYAMLREMGFSFPADVSLLTVDSTLNSIHPEITAIAYDLIKLFSAALDVLEPMMDGTKPQCLRYLVEPVIHQGSTFQRSRTE